MLIELSDVKVGRLRAPSVYKNGKTIPGDWRQNFKDRMDGVRYDYKTKKNVRELSVVFSDIPEDADAYHRNYMEYLEKCWRDHVGIVVTPDIIWHVVLCEVAGLVAADSERYRPLFTEQKEGKQTLIVKADGFVMPLDALVNLLRPLVPTNTDLFLPSFTTTTDRSLHAMHSAFCDLCSPYYNYMMLSCGFPAIDVRGTDADWAAMYGAWFQLSELLEQFKPLAWFENVSAVLRSCVSRLQDPEWWREMFTLERCGSGGDVEAYGWLTTLFREQPSTRYPSNFAACVSTVNYHHINLRADFVMKDGLFFSKYEGDFAVPDFGYTVSKKGHAEELVGTSEDCNWVGGE